MPAKKNSYLVDLRDQIADTFDLEELKALAFELNLDWDELHGSRKTTRIQDLITQLSRQGRLENLMETLGQIRPYVSWPEISSPQKQIQDIRTAFPQKPFYQNNWFVGLFATSVLIGIFALLMFQFQVPQRIKDFLIPQFPPEQEGETLIVIATFYHTEGVIDVAAHDEIFRTIQGKIDELNLENVRVAVEPTIIKPSNRKQVEDLGKKHNATLIIWGADTGVRIEVNFLNLKEPDFNAADTTISETTKTQLAKPDIYNHFIIHELPSQLTYLSLFALGQTEVNQGNYRQSIELIETAVASIQNLNEMDHRSLELNAAYFRLGWLYQTIDQLQPTIAAYDKAIDLNPEFAKAFNNRGNAYADLGEVERAIADFNEAIILNPEYDTAFYNRGNIYADLGEVERAIADYDKAISLNPEDATAHNNRGNAYADLDEVVQAIADYDQAISLNPELATAFNNRGSVYAGLGEVERAITDFDQAIILNSEYTEAFNNRGNIYSYLGEYERAIADYDQVIILNPEDAEAYKDRGNLYRNLGEHNLALADLQKFIQLEPLSTLGTVWNNVCWLGSLLGYAEDVVSACDKAVSLSTNMLEKASNLDSRGLNRALRGDFEGAISDFQAFVNFSQDVPDVEHYIEKRISWINSLTQNEDPFDPETLEKLLEE